jgi:hypothetical protein
LGKTTLNNIERQGGVIDDMYDKQGQLHCIINFTFCILKFNSERIYYNLGTAEKKTEKLNRGMLFTICWEPLVNIIKTKILRIQKKTKQRIKKNKRTKKPEMKKSKAEIESGMDAMMNIAAEMNKNLKEQNSTMRRVNVKTTKNQEKTENVQKKIDANLAGEHDGIL